MSQRIEDALEVLSIMGVLYSQTPGQPIAVIRNQAVDQVASRGVYGRTVFAHLVGKNVYNTLRASEFDRLAQKWLREGSDELENWYLAAAEQSDSQRIRSFFNAGGVTPEAFDIEEHDPSKRVLVQTYRVLRDTALGRRIKAEVDYQCQLCGITVRLDENRPYAEAHHVKPLGYDHGGPDSRDNILCVCPNCHVLLDYGAIELDPVTATSISREFVDYHNQFIFGRKRS